MQDLISIVVPIYNVEQYLSRCIDSILNQTYKNIEVLLINDGATDNSGKICEQYAVKDKRIRVIHKENGGLSDARNVGIDNANGKYICFVDSDDYVKKEYVETLYKLCLDYGVSISQCSFEIFHDYDSMSDDLGDTNTKSKLISGLEMLNNMYSQKGVENIVAWNKLFKKELFTDVRYPVGKIHEDEATIYKVIYKEENVAVTNKSLYRYYQRSDSITNDKFSLKRLDYLDALEGRLEFFKDSNESVLFAKTLRQYCYHSLILYYKCKVEIKDCKAILKKILDKYTYYINKLFQQGQLKGIRKYIYLIGGKFPSCVGAWLAFRNKNY